MSFGLQVWNEAGQIRLDTSDETMRITYTRAFASVTMAPRFHAEGNYAIPGFNMARDRVFLVPLEAGTLQYEGDNGSSDFMPHLSVTSTGVRIRWQGSSRGYDPAVRFMACQITVMSPL